MNGPDGHKIFSLALNNKKMTVDFEDLERSSLKRFQQISKTLLQISNAISSTTRLTELYRQIHYFLDEIIDTSNFFIALYSKDHDTLEFPYHVDEVDDHYPTVIEVSKTASLSAEVIKTGKPLLATRHYIEQLRSRKDVLQPSCSLCEIWLGVPLKVSDTVIGVMAVQSYSDPQKYTTDDLALLEIVAGQVATVVEYKKAEESIRVSQESYRRLVENITDGIFLSDAEGNIIDVNQAACKALGYTVKELRNLTIADVDSEVSNTQFKDMATRMLTEKPMIIESFHKRKDGTLLPVEINTTVYEQNGQRFIIGAARDVSDRRKAEEDARASVDRLHAFFDSINDAIFVHPLQEKGFSPFIEVNRIACERYGYTREEFLTLTAKDITSLDDAEEHGTINIRKKLLDEKQLTFETMHIKKNGEFFPVEINSNIIEQYGRPVILAVVRDITERKQSQAEKQQLEMQLLQSQKMESIGRLAGGIAHDFNNMLGVILGHIELIFDEIDEDNTIRKDLLKIRRTANHSADLVRQLLTFARKQPVSPQILDINEAIEDTLEMLIRIIGEEACLNWYPASGPLFVKIDPLQLQQILTNLCINAKDAVGTRGKISLSIKKTDAQSTVPAQLDNSQHTNFVTIIIEDDGEGIETTQLNRIFEPFYTTKSIGKGTGLGLATVYGIVKQNNGLITVESEIGKGTSFSIYLPQHMGAKPAKGRVEETLSQKRGQGTILVVEDDESLLAICKRMLEKEGFHVLTANTPSVAIEIAEKKDISIDLLLTDIIMPGMNGRELALKLAELHPGISKIYMSGYPAEVIANKGFISEELHYIAKPFTKKDLLKEIDKLL